MFRLGAELGSQQCFRSIGIEERPQVGIPTHYFRSIKRANPHVLEETNDLLLSIRKSPLDEWQALLAVDCVKGLEHKTISPLSAFTRNQWDKHVIAPGLFGHPPQEGQAEERHVARHHQTMLVRGPGNRALDATEGPELRMKVREDPGSE